MNDRSHTERDIEFFFGVGANPLAHVYVYVSFGCT